MSAPSPTFRWPRKLTKREAHRQNTLRELRHKVRLLEDAQANLVDEIRNARVGQPVKASVRSLREDLAKTNKLMAETWRALRTARARMSPSPAEPRNGVALNVVVRGEISAQALKPPTQHNHQLHTVVSRILRSRYPAKTLKGLHHHVLVSCGNQPPYMRRGREWIEYGNDERSKNALAKLFTLEDRVV